MAKNVDFNSLVKEVASKKLKYHDVYDVAAYLESIGWNDKRALESYGFSDIFEMAQQVYDIINQKIAAATHTSMEKINKSAFAVGIVKNFLRGLIFALPMAISVVAMLTLRFSLWSYEYLSTDLATSIAMGTILSFMTVGGYTQAIARRGFFYIIMGYYNMARKITYTLIRFGYLTITLISILLLVTSYTFSFFPIHMLMAIVLYYFFLSSIWLSVTVMYILKKELAFTGLIAFGIVIVGLLFLGLGLNIIASQLISLVIVTVLSNMLVIFFFRRAEMKMEDGLIPKMPKMSVTVYTVAPYFLYGLLYFTFLYVDRVMAWSANDSANMPYFLWFRGQYELGLDFALFTLIPPLGVIEVVVDSIMKQLELQIKNYNIDNIDELNAAFKRKYMQFLKLTIGVSIASGIAIYLILMYIDRHYSEILRFSISGSATIHFVLICAIIAYSVLAVGLMNAVLLFSLSQPKVINQALAAAMVINLGVGFVGSRWFSWLQDNIWSHIPLFGIEGYAFAILGLVAGSFYFTAMSIRAVKKVFQKLDYYLYSMS